MNSKVEEVVPRDAEPHRPARLKAAAWDPADIKPARRPQRDA